MEKSADEKRRQMMKEELRKLHDKKYIQTNVYHYVLQAHKRFYDDLHSTVKKDQKSKVASTTTQAKPVQTKEKTQKKKLTAQEIRERNITWSLSIGVIFLLIAGTFLATSTWDLLSNWMKTGMIALVSVMFFGLAIFTERILKINKTAFAFHVLGSLFLPIIILSLGFYEQLGSYLSFHGEGRYLFGALGSLFVLPIYLLLAMKLKARLFVWFTYVTLTFFVGFLLAWFNFSIDGFYLGIMLYNSLLVVLYIVIRKKKHWELFIKELLLYIQANVILSTLLLLIFYSNEVAYGFNLILTAIIYLGMIYVTNNKNYHFVFTIMLVYGAYQVIEFSVLQGIDAMAYALLGFIFLAIPKIADDKHQLTNIFNYTSGIVSGFAFLFITVQGIFLRMDQPSIVLFIAYVLIALNFTYLSNVVKKTFFSYLSPIFFITALFEAVRLGQNIFAYDSLVLPMFFTAFFLYVVFGCMMKLAFFQSVKNSSRDIAAIVMMFCLFLEFVINNWWQAGTMMLFISLTALIMNRYETRAFLEKNRPATWIHALALGLAVSMFYAEVQASQFRNDIGMLEPIGLILASMTVLIASAVWHQLKKQRFAEHAFFVSQGFYLFGMLSTFHILKYDFNPTTRALIIFGGIAMAYLLYRKTKWTFMPYVVSSISLLFYLTSLYAIHGHFQITSELFNSLQLPVGAVLLLAVGVIVKTYDKALTNAFWWVAHVYLPFTLFTSMIFYGETTFWAVLLTTVIYGISVLQTNVEWKVKIFLYASFTSFWLALTYLLLLMNMNEYVHYAWLITSIILATVWYQSATVWRKRITYFVIPFSIIGLSLFTFVYPFDLQAFGVTILYAVIVLAFMRAVQWDLFKLIPLILTFMAILNYNFFHPEIEFTLMLLFAVVFLSVGRLLYPVMYKTVKDSLPSVDWYTVFGFVALFSLYVFAGEALWEKLLPGLLISVGAYLQRKRIPPIAPKWILFFAITYLLEPYYALLNNIKVPELFSSEFYVLPWVALAILLKRFASEKHRKTVNYVQWAVLVIVALILVQDGLQSGTVYDALILGTLALASMLGGMVFKLKSFFFVGAGVLLLNVFLQTRPFWGSLPWWVYLLIAGSILIIVASYNEWHKQKTSEGKETIISFINKRVIQKIKRWE